MFVRPLDELLEFTLPGTNIMDSSELSCDMIISYGFDYNIGRNLRDVGSYRVHHNGSLWVASVGGSIAGALGASVESGMVTTLRGLSWGIDL